MRFVIVDLEGASRDYFSQLPDVVEALEELEAEQPGMAAELFISAYDAAGRLLAEPERGDELLVRVKDSAKTYWYGELAVAGGDAAETEWVNQDRELLVGAGRSPASGSA